MSSNITGSETDLISNLPQGGRSSNMEEFRSMMHSNSARNNEKTLETAFPSNEEFSSQMSRVLEEKTAILNTQNLPAEDAAINEQVISQL